MILKSNTRLYEGIPDLYAKGSRISMKFLSYKK
jgi:hypothetical protein